MNDTEAQTSQGRNQLWLSIEAHKLVQFTNGGFHFWSNPQDVCSRIYALNTKEKVFVFMGKKSSLDNQKTDETPAIQKLVFCQPCASERVTHQSDWSLCNTLIIVGAGFSHSGIFQRWRMMANAAGTGTLTPSRLQSCSRIVKGRGANICTPF